MDRLGQSVKALRELFREYSNSEISAVLLYGSASRGDASPNISDIDVMVFLSSSELSKKTAKALHLVTSKMHQEYPEFQTIMKVYDSTQLESLLAPYLDDAYCMFSYSKGKILFGRDIRSLLRDSVSNWSTTDVAKYALARMVKLLYMMRSHLVSSTSIFPQAKNQPPGVSYSDPKFVGQLIAADAVLDAASHALLFLGLFVLEKQSILDSAAQLPYDTSVVAQAVACKNGHAPSQHFLNNSFLFIRNSLRFAQEKQRYHKLNTAFSFLLKEKDLPYRANACLVLLNKSNEVLVVLDKRSEEWKLLQGGIQDGETCAQAAKRELFEEVGITSIDVLGEVEAKIKYDWPESLQREKGKRGQQLSVMVARTKQTELVLDEDEILDAKWISLEKASSLLQPHRYRPLRLALSQGVIHA